MTPASSGSVSHRGPAFWPSTSRASYRFGALVCFTGGLIGPAEAELTRPANVAGMTALFATSDIDELVPLARVEKTASIYRSAGAEVVPAVFPGAGHEIVDDSIERCRTLLDRIAGQRAPG
jgi:phospholipase/carboxylesterase